MKHLFEPLVESGVVSQDTVDKLADSIEVFDEIGTRYIIVGQSPAVGSSFPDVTWDSVEAVVETLSAVPEGEHLILRALSVNPGVPFVRSGWVARAYSDESLTVSDRHECVFWPQITGDQTFGHVTDQSSPWGDQTKTMSTHFSDESQDHAIKMARQQLAEHVAKKEASV